MSKYKFNLEEVLNREIIVEAKDIDDALSIIKSLYKEEKIVLDDNDFVECNISYIGKEK